MSYTLTKGKHPSAGTLKLSTHLLETMCEKLLPNLAEKQYVKNCKQIWQKKQYVKNC